MRRFPRARWLATLVGLVLVAGAAATAATVAVAFGSYLSDFAKVPVWLAAVALLAAATALCVFGLRESTWVNIVFTLIEVGGLVLFVAVGAGAPGFGAALTTPPHFGVMSGAALVLSLGGTHGTEYGASGMRYQTAPIRLVPRSDRPELLFYSVLEHPYRHPYGSRTRSIRRFVLARGLERASSSSRLRQVRDRRRQCSVGHRDGSGTYPAPRPRIASRRSAASRCMVGRLCE